MHSNTLIHIATLKKPYGILGWLWVISHLQDRQAIFAMPNWQMQTPAGEFLPLTVQQWRKQGAGLVASFVQIPDRNTAEKMHDITIWTDRVYLPALADDEYYWSDLVGMMVLNTQDECLGVIKSLFATGANDVMIVAASAESIDDSERLIPWHKSVIESVDLVQRQVVVVWDKSF